MYKTHIYTYINTYIYINIYIHVDGGGDAPMH